MIREMSADPMETLAAAVRSGDAARAGAVLAEHPGLHGRLDEAIPGGAFGATALLTAVHRGDRNIAELLLDAGADIDQRSHWWAGSFGVLDGESPLVPWLIQRGARVDAYAAARHGMMNELRALVEADPSAVRMRGGDGQTPLHVAKSVEVARYLLEHGADIDALDVDHESTPAQYLVRERPEVAKYLAGRGCRTDILLAAALGDLALVRKHLEENPASIEMCVSEEDFPKRDPRAGGTIYRWTLGYQKTPQMLAREFKHDEVFRFLMDRTPGMLKLALACEWGDQEEVERLLSGEPDLAGALPNRLAMRLTSAAQDGNLAAVRLMLRAGWPVDIRGHEGGTAIHWAAFHGNAEMVREILRYKPDLTLRDRTYQGTALDWALHGAGNSWKRESGSYAEAIALLREQATGNRQQ
jgi:ankyrin repeat protein